MNLETFKILRYDVRHCFYIVEIDQKEEHMTTDQVERIVAMIIRLTLENILGHTSLYNMGRIEEIFNVVLDYFKWKKIE